MVELMRSSHGRINVEGFPDPSKLYAVFGSLL
jgi:hypothetical protein